MPKPTNQQLNVLAAALARNMAYCPADIDDLKQEALWAAHLAFKRTPQPRKPLAFTRTIMQRAIATYYLKHLRHQIKHEPLLPATACAAPDPIEHNLFLQQFFTALECNHGREARRIVENLIAPRDPIVCKYLINKAARQQRQMRRGRKTRRTRFRGVQRIRLSQQQLREALGYTRGQWSRILRDIRAFTRAWLEQTNSTDKADYINEDRLVASRTGKFAKALTGSRGGGQPWGATGAGEHNRFDIP